MDKKQTKKVKKYALARAQGANKREAKIDAGMHPETPTKQVEDTEVFRTAKKSLVRAMEKVGITDELIAKRIKDLLGKKQISLSFGKKVVVSNTDPAAVKAALEHIAKVRGDYEPLKVQAVNPLDGIPIGDLMGALHKAQEDGNLNIDLFPELVQ